MVKYIFKKKKINKFYFFLLFVTLLILIYFSFLKSNKYVFNFPEINKQYFLIPKDKGGEIVSNLNKKSLHLNSIKTENIFNNENELFYSIQMMSSTDLTKIQSFLNSLINSNENKYYEDDFYIVALNTTIGIDYFLLYKNFENKEKAIVYCNKYIDKLKKCLIVNVQNF